MHTGQNPGRPKGHMFVGLRNQPPLASEDLR